MNEKEWLIEMTENFISDLSDYSGNTNEPTIVPFVKSMMDILEVYIMLIKSTK